MKTTDIPKFICNPNYSTHINWKYIEKTLSDYNEWITIERMGGLNLNPDFQRGHVWSENKQIAFVEYCLKGGLGSKDILFNHPNWQGSFEGEIVLVDGKQRLEAVRKFIRNELPVFDGHCLNDFEDKDRLLRMNGANFIFKINNLKTRKEVLQWYLDLNTGGVVHTNEEIKKVQQLLEQEKEQEQE